MVDTGSCPGVTVSGSNLSIQGTVTYNADGTDTATDTFSGTVSVYLPPACLTMNGVTVTCAQLNQQFASNPMPGVTVSCSGSSGCTCLETISGESNTTTGTYSVAANGVLSETNADGTVSQTDYCVKGTTMTQSPHAGSTMMGAASGTITLTKS